MTKWTKSAAAWCLAALLPGSGAAEGLPELHGFVQLHAAARLGGVDCAPETACGLPYNEQRLQLKTEGGGLKGAFGYAAKLDLVHDAALDESDAEVRELYADYNGERMSLRGGRQVVTWGVADLLFINDTFPKDWVSFFGGLPLEYLKLGSDALRIDLFPDLADVQLVPTGVSAELETQGQAEEVYDWKAQPKPSGPITQDKTSPQPAPAPGLPTDVPAIVHVYFDAAGKLDPARHAGAVYLYLVTIDNGAPLRLRITIHPLGAVTWDYVDLLPWETPPRNPNQPGDTP